MADKIIIDGQELEDVNGGQGQAGYYMTVGDCNGGYLALRPQPVWEGTGLNGIPCTYTYVCWNGIWGWANSAFLR